MQQKKTILVAPLNWGLGHATRCIPIIKKLLEHNFKVILASDGMALSLLKKEFPELTAICLPSYNVSYSKHSFLLKWKLLLQARHILKIIRAENKQVIQLIKKHHISGIISDNRFGVYAPNVPSVFITHQLQVLSGITTWFSTKIQHYFIKKFNECWVPDNKETPYLSGKLGHLKHYPIPTKYLGVISRFKQNRTENLHFDLLVLLSGPEPQRSILDDLLRNKLKGYTKKFIFVSGKIETEQKITKKGSGIFYNFATSTELEKLIAQSKVIVSRPGYTTIMDLARLEKKAFFLPTPGQTEQWYLAKFLQSKNIAPYIKQQKFNLNKLVLVNQFLGLSVTNKKTNWGDLFSLF